MFYCPNCNNTYDIARTSSQTGGKMIKLSDITSTETDEMNIAQKLAELDAVSTINDDQSNVVTGGASVNTIIGKILKDENVDVADLKGLKLDDVVKSMEYKKLKTEEKEKVYNKIQDLVPKESKKIIESKPAEASDENLAFFVCSNCGYSVRIEDGTRIFSRTSSDISQSYDTGEYSDMLYSSILPRTRKYVCPNKKCESHTDSEKRQAVFFRKNNSYEVVYICIACETAF